MPSREAGSALAPLGWDDHWSTAARSAGVDTGARPGRVVRVDLGRATVLTGDGQEYASLGGHSVATGDWVLVDGREVLAVLPRRSAFVRGDPIEGRAVKEQVVAANVDVVLVVQSLTNGPNVRRLERELVLAFESGATPALVLTKSDLVDAETIARAFDDVRAATADVDVFVTSAVTGEGVEQIAQLAHDRRTIAFIGASGVGKSMLVNRLVGRDVQATGDVREHDQRGRHTTTARELVPLPGGGVLLDTPGLRAVSLWDADDGFSRAFADIEQLAEQCKFSDCAHTSEPGCAVLAAIERGELDPDRFAHYRRLDQELDDADRKRRARILSKDRRRTFKR